MRMLIAMITLAMLAAPWAKGDDPVPTSRAADASSPTSRQASGDDKLSTTHHSITVGGAKLDYTATAGTILMKDNQAKPLANMFFVAYTMDRPADASGGAASTDDTTRPITFVFNGGPGAAAVWLQLGTVGPWRVALGPDGIPGPPPHRLIENDMTWLTFTDLVFIDPVGTGFSRPAEGRKGDEFFGVDQDINSVGDFIRLYLTRYRRWLSPKFLAGESYGTTRAAGLSNQLLQRWGIDVNGIILISSVLDFQTLSPSDANDLPYALYLPSFAAIALYHHKTQAPDPAKLLDEVGQYAMNDYLTALARGGNLAKDVRARVVERLSHYTGLSPDLIDKANLRISPEMFRKHLLADQRLVLGRFDARLTAIDTDPGSEDPQYDPAFSLYFPLYNATFNQYIRDQLHFESDLPYEVLTGAVQPWDFGRRGASKGTGYLDVIDSLRTAMVDNPGLRVLVAAGYEDLATPYQAAKFTVDHLDLTNRLQGNVTQTFYHSGHMIYHDPPSQAQLTRDIQAFVAGVK